MHYTFITSFQNSSTTFLSDETTPTTLLSKSKTPPPRYITKSGTSNLRRVNPNACSRFEDTNAKASDSRIVPLDSKVTGEKIYKYLGCRLNVIRWVNDPEEFDEPPKMSIQVAIASGISTSLNEGLKNNIFGNNLNGHAVTVQVDIFSSLSRWVAWTSTQLFNDCCWFLFRWFDQTLLVRLPVHTHRALLTSRSRSAGRMCPICSQKSFTDTVLHVLWVFRLTTYLNSLRLPHRRAAANAKSWCMHWQSLSLSSTSYSRIE